MMMNAFAGASATSNHFETAGNLFIRKLEQEVVPWKEPRPLNDVWDDFVTVFPRVRTEPYKALLPFRFAKNKLAKVMECKYADEEAFDLALFGALRACFNTYVLTGDDQNNSNYTFLYATDEYAVGFARNKDSTLHGLVGTDSNNTSSGLAAGCRPDHGSWLFEKIDGFWTATDIFSSVELKASARSCKNFATNTKNSVTAVNLRSSHGAFGQAILYTIGSVLRNHAKHGVLRERRATMPDGAMVQKTLPLAVLAGRTIDSVPSRVRWVSGDLLIPETCCNQYFYRVKSFGNFCDHPVDEKKSMEQALSVYLDALLVGIRAAILVYRDRLSDVTNNPDPITGMTLMIGNQTLNWPILATPITMPMGGDQKSMIVSQAELFRGELNVHDIFTSEVKDCLVFDSKNECVPVIIKASSAAVHRTLILPDTAYNALDAASSVLRSPLLAAVQMTAGLITVMDDLSKQGYRILRPNVGFSTKLAPLWKGFMELVTTVLLPLAERNVVHADIRPGFDFTANILYRELDGGSVQMQLIDYESLVKLKEWIAPSNEAGYLRKKQFWDATTFVLWQCIIVAYAWLEERKLVRKGTILAESADIRDLQELGDLPTWLPHSCTCHARSDANTIQSVTTTLEKLDQVFVVRDSLKERQEKSEILETLAEMAKSL